MTALRWDLFDCLPGNARDGLVAKISEIDLLIAYNELGIREM